MQSRLIVKNFGPIKEVDLDLRNVNVFIGPQASGKSALAKVYTIFKAPRKFFYKYDTNKNGKRIFNNERALKEFKEAFDDYNIASFLKEDTEIVFESELHSISYKNKALEYIPKFARNIEELEILATDNFDNNRQELIDRLTELDKRLLWFSAFVGEELEKNGAKFGNLNTSNFLDVIDILKSIETDLSSNSSIYIPSERNFINIIKKSSLNLILNNVPIPKHILSFGAELEKIDVDKIDLSFIQNGLIYRIVNGEDRIYLDDNNSIKLNEAASGIQSAVPVLIPILNRKDPTSHTSFVIEEPELNLFPAAQYKLIQLLESSRREPNLIWRDYGTIHTYTTHSPYILSGLNNLLYAHKVRSTLIRKGYDKEGKPTEEYFEVSERTDKAINDIVSATINPHSFTAYQISNGHAESIFDRKTGLIKENYIDTASDKINEDFEALMELTK